MTTKLQPRTGLATALIAVAACLLSVSAYAAQAGGSEDSNKVHPVAETKKAAKAVGHGVKKTTKVVGHGFRNGARAIGHGTRKVTKSIGHAFRDGVHEVEGKK